MSFLKDVGKVAGPLIEGVFGLGGAALGAGSQNKATEQQAAATQAALDFQREQAAKAEEAYRQRFMEHQAMRAALLQRYGIDVPGLGDVGPPPGGPPGAVPRSGVQEGVGGGRSGMPPHMADRQGGPPPGGVPPRAGLSLGEMARRPFYDWNSFGRGG